MVAPTSWFKLNFNGLAHYSLAIVGGIIRDDKGYIVTTYSGNYGKNNRKFTKAMRLFLGIKYASSIGIQNLVFEGDPQLIIEVDKE